MSKQQTPDAKPGNYYVSVRDGGKTGFLAGPFVNDHAAALEMVKPAMNKACELNQLAWFYAYGTVRLPSDYTKPGALNRHLGLPTTIETEGA